MSHQALYQVLSLSGYRVTRLEREEKKLLVHLEPQPHRMCCPECGSREVIRRGEKVRWLRHLPIGRECNWLLVTVPRVECRACRLVRQVPLGLADARRT